MRKSHSNRLRALSVAQRRRNQRIKHWKIDCRRRVMFLQDFYKEE